MIIDKYKHIKYYGDQRKLPNSEILGNISSYETFGTFDGPGIRLVLFFQGCPFQCKFCHNRDTWDTQEKTLMSVKDVEYLFKQYETFYGKGGLTVSGGEATMQPEFLKSLFKKFKEKKIHTCLDTSAGCFNSRSEYSIQKYREILEYTDLVLLDIKQIDDEKHLELTGRSNKEVLEFAKFLDENGINTIIRHVLIPGYTDDDNDLKGLRQFINGLSNIVKIEVLPYHSAGELKWKQMGLVYPLEGIKPPTKDRIRNAEHILKSGFDYKK